MVRKNLDYIEVKRRNVKGENAHHIYKWAKDTFGNSAIPKWNFHKILINSNGKIADTFTSLTNPQSKKITSKIEELINN